MRANRSGSALVDIWVAVQLLDQTRHGFEMLSDSPDAVSWSAFLHSRTRSSFVAFVAFVASWRRGVVALSAASKNEIRHHKRLLREGSLRDYTHPTVTSPPPLRSATAPALAHTPPSRPGS
jgi:hypothetical protein